MKRFFQIKWETIMTLMLFAITIYGWFVYSNYANDTKVLAIACITTFMFLMVLMSYKTIKNIRHEILNSWY